MRIPDFLKSRAVITLDFKTAFGTGGHGTTEGCLLVLEKFIRGEESVLDAGTGGAETVEGRFDVVAANLRTPILVELMDAMSFLFRQARCLGVGLGFFCRPRIAPGLFRPSRKDSAAAISFLKFRIPK